jgi:hypothetical protein
MRYITVPYTLTLLSFNAGDSISLDEIWKKQAVPKELKSKIYSLMIQVEQFIKQNAPGALYGEWAKKEECWLALKNQKSF